MGCHWALRYGWCTLLGRQAAHAHALIALPPCPSTSTPRPQVGLPSSREQYIHRLGRTARAGRNGRGLLILMPEEQHFIRQLKDLPLTAEKGPLATPQDEAAVRAALPRVGDRLPEMVRCAACARLSTAGLHGGCHHTTRSCTSPAG